MLAKANLFRRWWRLRGIGNTTDSRPGVFDKSPFEIHLFRPKNILTKLLSPMILPKKGLTSQCRSTKFLCNGGLTWMAFELA
jgi:hypothetical protein